MKVPPNLSCSLGVIARAIMSVEPPAGNGTTTVTELSGQARAFDIEIVITIQAKTFLKRFTFHP
jgi:hypothetical protein